MSTTTHELETVQIQGLKAALQDGGNVGIYNKATCSTAGGTAAKVTNTVPKSFSLVSEATIFVKFTYTISVANATLKVGNNDAKPIYYRNAPLPANVVKAGDILTLRYNGTQFEVINSLGETYESKQAASGGTDLSLVTTGEKDTWNNMIPSSQKGASNGVASLDANGKVPSSQLQSYVDDVIEGYYKKADGKFYEESTYTTEITGESGKIYTDLSTNTTYRWSGTQFTQIKGDLAIGTTTGTAADGGIVNTHVNDSDIHVTLQDKSNWSGKQDALVFNTAYDATTNKAATMADVPDAQIQSDWNQTTTTAKDYIKNKPTNLVHSGTASGSANQADFNANADTVHNKAQVLSSTQQGQARKNINAAGIDEAVVCIESNSAPTTSTLSYTDSFGTSRNYKVGDQVKVYDSTEGKYKIYTLFNINNGTATWEQGEGGTSGTSFYTPTLSAAPTSSTTTYTKDGVTVNFVIGQFARVADATMDTGYKFYQLADLNNGVAAWQEMGTPLERVTINLSANANLAALRSAAPTVTVTSTKSAGTLFSGAWTGDALKLKVEPGDTYIVSVEEVEGFATPASQTYDAELEGVNSISFSYTTVEWSVAITSNQSSDATIAALTGTAEWTYNGNSYSERGLADGDVVYIPTGVTPTFTIADATEYKKTVTISSPSITASYETEVVTVTVGTDQSGVTAEGQVITINGSNYTVGASGVVTAKVPYDVAYTISADAKSGYMTPASQSFTASQASRAVTVTWEKVRLGIYAYYSDGSLKDYDNADSSAIGVAVLTSNASFVMDKNALPDAVFGGSGVDMSNIGVVMTNNAYIAKTDFDGAGNTMKIINKLGIGNAPAAEACRAAFGGVGYLGSCGEWNEAATNKADIRSMMTKIGGTAIADDYFWTSTLSDATNGAWKLGWYDNITGPDGRWLNACVRAFRAL